MSTKYQKAVVTTSDIYLVAYLLYKGNTIVDTLSNRKKRISFVVAGGSVTALKQAFKSGGVVVDIPSFRVHLQSVHRLQSEKRRELWSMNH